MELIGYRGVESPTSIALCPPHKLLASTTAALGGGNSCIDLVRLWKEEGSRSSGGPSRLSPSSGTVPAASTGWHGLGVAHVPSITSACSRASSTAAMSQCASLGPLAFVVVINYSYLSSLLPSMNASILCS